MDISLFEIAKTATVSGENLPECKLNRSKFSQFIHGAYGYYNLYSSEHGIIAVYYTDRIECFSHTVLKLTSPTDFRPFSTVAYTISLGRAQCIAHPFKRYPDMFLHIASAVTEDSRQSGITLSSVSVTLI